VRLQVLLKTGGDGGKSLDSPDDVTQALEEKKADKTLIVVEPRAKQEYDELRGKIDLRRDEQEQLRLAASSGELSFEAKVDGFRAKMLNMAQKLGKRFGRIMEDLGFQGSVDMHFEDADRNNVEKWGLLCRVSLKESMPLKVLSDQLSGGERSMSTMLLLLAMQETTPMPFRIVDEINQGVSAFNERGLMNTLTRLFDKEDETGKVVPGALAFSPRQLWVVTPKLLPDLRHAPSMRTVVVFNGPRMAGHKHAFSHFVSFTKLAAGASTRPRMAADEVLDFSAPVELSDDDEVVVEEEEYGGEEEEEEEEEEEGGGSGGGGGGGRGADASRKRKAVASVEGQEEEEDDDEGGGRARGSPRRKV
jgi:hypothetical protein